MKLIPRRQRVEPAPIRRFVRNPAAGEVILPKIGKVGNQTLVGEEFVKYAPHFLLEVPAQGTGRPVETSLAAGPRLLTEVPESPQGPVLLTEAPVKRPRGRPRKVPLPAPVAPSPTETIDPTDPTDAA